MAFLASMLTPAYVDSTIAAGSASVAIGESVHDLLLPLNFKYGKHQVVSAAVSRSTSAGSSRTPSSAGADSSPSSNISTRLDLPPGLEEYALFGQVLPPPGLEDRPCLPKMAPGLHLSNQDSVDAKICSSPQFENLSPPPGLEGEVRHRQFSPPPGLEDVVPRPQVFPNMVAFAVSREMETEDLRFGLVNRPATLPPPPPQAAPDMMCAVVKPSTQSPMLPPAPQYAPPPMSAPPPVLPCADSQTFLEGPPVAPAAGSPELPTVGSVGHDLRTCKPCAFVHRDLGCSRGVVCPFCHLCDAGETSRRRKEKRAALSAAKKGQKL